LLGDEKIDTGSTFLEGDAATVVPANGDGVDPIAVFGCAAGDENGEGRSNGLELEFSPDMNGEEAGNGATGLFIGVFAP
jgi:hypothetical protein